MKLKLTSIDLLTDFFDELDEEGFEFPDFREASEVIIFSDYSGDRPQDKYYAYSYYIVDSKSTFDLGGDIWDFRSKNERLADNSFFEYKNLKRHKLKQKLLANFLSIFDMKKGLILTVLVDKTSRDYFFRVDDEQAQKINKLIGGKWKTEIIRKQSNILSLLSFIVKRFLNKRTKLTWYSDRDPIFGGSDVSKKQTLDLLSRFFT